MWVEWWRMRWEEVRVEDVHKKQWMMLLPDGSTARDVTRWVVWVYMDICVGGSQSVVSAHVVWKLIAVL